MVLLVGVALTCSAMAWGADAKPTPAKDDKAQAPARPTPREMLEQTDPTALARWRRHWRIYGKQCIAFNDDYIVCPTYSPRYDSSRQLTVEDAQRQLVVREKVRVGPNLTKLRDRMPLREDVEPVVRSLPAMAIGEWGCIQSGEVTQVIDADEVMLEKCQLIDADEVKQAKKRREQELTSEAEARADAEQRQTGRKVSVNRGDIRDAVDYEFEQREKLVDAQKNKAFSEPVRVIGFSTAGLVEKIRWSGPGGAGLQVAIVAMEEYGDKKKPKTRFIAVPASWFRHGLEEEDFIRLIQKRGMDIESFVDFMQNAKRDDPQTGDDRVFNRLMPPMQRLGS